MRVGFIARMCPSGLGIQSRRLARLIQPDRIMVIDSTPFNGHTQYPEWYRGFDRITVNGFPSDIQIKEFLEKVDAVISCEMFYSNRFTSIAKHMKVKTILIANPEFFDWFKPSWTHIPQPDKVIVPSRWKMNEMKYFHAKYLPTPIFEDEFQLARDINLKRSGRKFLFINGKTAVHDRNGLDLLYNALPLSKSEYTITIKAQDNIKKHPDPRLIYDFSVPENPQELYTSFDALIHPRRYAGQSLSMCEALQSALPVIMLDREPDNLILPEDWLIPAQISNSFMARTKVNIYSTAPEDFAYKLDHFNLTKEAKERAYNIGRQYDAEKLRSKYEELLQ